MIGREGEKVNYFRTHLSIDLFRLVPSFALSERVFSLSAFPLITPLEFSLLGYEIMPLL